MTDTFTPRHDWPIVKRYNLTQKIPKGYKTDPEDTSIFILPHLLYLINKKFNF